MASSKPDWVQGDYGVGYGDVVDSWGYEVLSFDTTGSYQGDHEVLLKDGPRFGYIIFGYGSCSGCDALEAIAPWGSDKNADWTEVIEFAAELEKSIEWFPSATALVESIQALDKARSWYANDDEIKQVFADWAAMLGLPRADETTVSSDVGF